MNKPRCILLTVNKVEDGVDMVRDACPHTEVRVAPYISDEGQNIPADLMKGVDVLYCEMPGDNFRDFDSLRWVQITSAGYSQILKLPILERGITVTNGLGTFDIPIAEWTILMMLAW